MWLIAAIGVALVGQKVGGMLLPPSYSGAVGAFLVVPFAMLASRDQDLAAGDRDDAGCVLGVGPRRAELRLLSEAATGGRAESPHGSRFRHLLDALGHAGDIAECTVLHYFRVRSGALRDDHPARPDSPPTIR